MISLLGACNWFNWEKGSYDEIVNNSSTKSIKLNANNNKASKGKTINLDISITKEVPNDSKLHEIIGVCFEVDGYLGGYCNDKPLPDCIELKNDAKTFKDFGIYDLKADTPKVLSQSLVFTCNEAKTVTVSAGIKSHWIRPKLTANWYHIADEDSNIEIVFK